MDIETIGREIVDSAIKVHSELGPGLLESAYELCLAHELRKRGFSVETQVPQGITYDVETVSTAYRLDLLVNNQVIIELKAVEELSPVHKTQIITYLKLSNKKLGYLINFNVKLLKYGLQRFVN